MSLQLFSEPCLVRVIYNIQYIINDITISLEFEFPYVFQSADSIIGFHQVAFQKDLPAEIFRRGDKIQGIPHQCEEDYTRHEISRSALQVSIHQTLTAVPEEKDTVRIFRQENPGRNVSEDLMLTEQFPDGTSSVSGASPYLSE